jgi:threonine/homoserine/homoserine lactone efflux protein
MTSVAIFFTSLLPHQGRPVMRRLIDALVGMVLTAFGYRLATERT